MIPRPWRTVEQWVSSPAEMAAMTVPMLADPLGVTFIAVTDHRVVSWVVVVEATVRLE
jgi:hypothetical protein